MKVERWRQIDALLDAALERGPSERSDFLRQACGGDEELRKEVESLLAAHLKAGSFIEQAPAEDLTLLLDGDQFKSIVGETLGRYKILSLLGSGGMGQVYRARDATLGREVAVKVLPAAFTQDADRVRRFEQEARAASSLNHPNIITIYEIGRTGRAHFIAAELVEGRTLRQQMADGRMKLSAALDVTAQVASALAAAHAAGIAHRDIKPENIMMRPDGLVKVLDFGLAKLVEQQGPAPGDDALASESSGTLPGVVMGTVGYMSPEQVRAAKVDARTDIFSLGVVLYEVLAGRQPFRGDSAVEVMNAILKEDPAELTAGDFEPRGSREPISPALEKVVGRCLEKRPEARFQSASDLAFALRSLSEGSGSNVTSLTERKDVPAPVDSSRPKRFLWAAGILGGALLLAVAGLYLFWFRKGTDAPQLSLTAVPLTTDPGYEGMPSLSPDGSYVAFMSAGLQNDNFDIYVKQINGGPPIRLTSDPAVDSSPAWSPDGRSIAFVRERGGKQEVLLIPALGGPERKLAQIAPDLPEAISQKSTYLSWSPDSKYLVTLDRTSEEEPTGLFVLSVVTGEKRPLTTPPAPALADTSPAVSQDGRALAFVRLISTAHPQIYVLPLSEDCRATGEARRLDLRQPWALSPAWTADGRDIVCDAGPSWQGGMLWRVSVSDSEKPLFLASLGKTSYYPILSRQGNRIVYQVWTWNPEIWRVSGRDRSRPAEKLAASTRAEINAQYSSDGSRIVFQSDRSGNSEIWVSNSDGLNPVQLTSLESSSGTPRWFPDGKRVVFDSQKEGQSEIYVIDTDTRVPRRLTSDPTDDVTPSVSHDGNWVYFSSTRTGRWEIWRMPAEGGLAV
jgi:serine/threonine protein kinase